jgi:hypothetical protein
MSDPPAERLPAPPRFPEEVKCLDVQLMRRVNEALATVGDFGEVRLIVVKGRVRFIQVVRSEDLNTA